MRITEILSILRDCSSGRIALIAPNSAEAKLLLHRFSLSTHVPEGANYNGNEITFDGMAIEFLTPTESYKSKADHFIVEFPDMLTDPDMYDVRMNAEEIILSEEIR